MSVGERVVIAPDKFSQVMSLSENYFSLRPVVYGRQASPIQKRGNMCHRWPLLIATIFSTLSPIFLQVPVTRDIVQWNCYLQLCFYCERYWWRRETGYSVALGEGLIGYRLLQYNVRRNATVSIAHIILSIDFISTLYREAIQQRGNWWKQFCWTKGRSWMGPRGLRRYYTLRV